MHCHLEVHTSWGLKMAWIVLDGKLPNQKLLPPPSVNFNKKLLYFVLTFWPILLFNTGQVGNHYVTEIAQSLFRFFYHLYLLM